MNDKAKDISNSNWKKIFCLGIFVFAMSVMISEPVYAVPANLAGFCPVDETGEGVQLFSSLMPCLIEHIQTHGRVLITHMQTITQPVFNSFLALTVLIYGLLLITGMLQKAGRDTFVFLIKIAVVVWVTDNLIYVHDAMFTLMQALVQAVTVTGDVGGGVRCQVEATVWGQLDCIVDMVIGIGHENTQMLTNGLLAFFLSAFFSGSMGALVGLLGLYFCVNLVIGVVKAAYIYVLAILSLVLLIMIGSLLIPMIFFKTTFGYFSSWSTMVLSSVLQPMLLFAFLSVVISAMDVIIYSGENSIYHTIAGDAADSPEFNLALYLTNNCIYREDNVIIVNRDSTRESYAKEGSSADETGDEGVTQNITTLGDGADGAEAPTLRADGNNWGDGLPVPILDWNFLTAVSEGNGAVLGENGSIETCPEPSSEEASSTKLLEIATAFIIASLSGFMFVTMLDHVPKIARDLSGGAYNTPALNGTGFEGASQQLLSQVGSGTASLAGRVGSMVSGR